MLWASDRQVIVPGRWPGISIPKRTRLPRLRRVPWQFIVTEAALTSGNSSTDGTSVATASFTPTANRLILAAILTRRSGAVATQPTMTGNSLTWVLVNGGGNGGDNRERVDIFRSMGASPAAGAATWDYGGVTQHSFCWSVAEFAGIDTSGTNGSGAVVQSVYNAGDGNDHTSHTVTLAAFGDAGNATYGAFGVSFVSEDTTPGTGFTEIHDVGNADQPMRIFTEWRNDNDTTVDSSSATATIRYGGAVEIKAAAAGGAATHPGWISSKGGWH